MQRGKDSFAQVLTDATGAIAWEAHYRPFGEAITTGSLDFPLRFPGQYHDAETGLHYNWHRYYDPQTGRYLTSDPIGLAGGLNPYLYAEANPLYYVDPTGEIGVPGAIYGGLAGGVGGYISGGWVGVIPGTLFGAVTGLAIPANSGLVGASIGAGAASLMGQSAGNIASGEDPLDTCNYSWGAVSGAAIGGFWGANINRVITPYFPVIRLEVIGKNVGSKTVLRIPGNVSGAVVEGGFVGAGEKLGNNL